MAWLLFLSNEQRVDRSSSSSNVPSTVPRDFSCPAFLNCLLDLWYRWVTVCSRTDVFLDNPPKNHLTHFPWALTHFRQLSTCDLTRFSLFMGIEYNYLKSFKHFDPPSNWSRQDEKQKKWILTTISGVPSGLFVPCLLIGATYGRIFAFCYQQIFKTTNPS